MTEATEGMDRVVGVLLMTRYGYGGIPVTGTVLDPAMRGSVSSAGSSVSVLGVSSIVPLPLHETWERGLVIPGLQSLSVAGAVRERAAGATRRFLRGLPVCVH